MLGKSSKRIIWRRGRDSVLDLDDDAVLGCVDWDAAEVGVEGTANTD